MRARKHTSSNIDITPLMDLTFMLLIIFIITVPAIEYSTDVTPPSMDTPRTVEDIPDKTVIALSKDGVLTLNGSPLATGELLPALRDIHRATPNANVLIISDGSRRYDEIIELHRIAYHAGIKNIFLVTQAERL